MAPIEPDLSRPNLESLAIFGSYLLNTVGLTAFLSYFAIYRAFQSLPPSQATRFRASSRKKHVQIFSALAIVSLGVTWYYMLSFFWLSYRSWASEMGELVPGHFWSEYTRGQIQGLELGRWLKDTELFREAWEIASEKSGRYWWTQQIFLGAAAWSVFLGIEGRRRQIPHLWAFMLLAQTVAVSFAMNLFFVAILLRPVTSPPKAPSSNSISARLPIPKPNQPILRRILLFFAAKPLTYQPHPLLYIFPLFACYAGVFLLPFSTSTPSFMTVLLIPHLVLFQPIFLDRAVFPFWDRLPGSRSPRVIYRFMAVCSMLLYTKQTIVALLDNDPSAHAHKHSAALSYLHLRNPEHHGPIERSTTAISRILGSLSDHPATASVGWDVILCGLSLVAWASVRGLDIMKITGNIGLNRIPDDESSVQDAKEGDGKEAEQITKRTRSKGENVSKARSNGGTASRRRRRRRRGASASDGEGYDADSSLEVAKGEEEVPENPEAGAASWGLFIIGGLGAMASGVLGAEIDR